MSRKAALWLLVGIVLFGVGLRSFELTSRSLWFDEAFSWRLVQFPVKEMIDRAAQDVHPPLYYLLLRGWTFVFGLSVVALRSFSVVFAGATVAAAFLFVKSAFRSNYAALLASLLIAVSGWQIQFAWEARMYTLGTFLAIVSSWLLVVATRKTKGGLGIWMLYGGIIAAFAYIHYIAFYTIAAHALFVAGSIIDRTKWRIGEMLQLRLTWHALVAAVIAALIYAPWFPVFLSQNARVQEQYWVPRIGGWSIPDTFYRMAIPTAGIPSHAGFAMVGTIIPLFIVTVSWILLVRWKKSAGSWLVVLCAVAPFVLSIVVSFVGQSLYQDRFLIFAQPFILIGFAVLIARIPFLIFRRIVTIGVVGGFLVAYIMFWQELDISNKPGVRTAAKYISANMQDGDRVVVNSPFVFFPLLHYAKEEFKGKLDPKLYSSSGDLVHFAGGPILITDDVVGPVVWESASRTVWAVDTTGFGGNKLEAPSGWKSRSTQPFEEVYPYQGKVYVTEYERMIK